MIFWSYLLPTQSRCKTSALCDIGLQKYRKVVCALHNVQKNKLDEILAGN